jgi:hypothetical protein
MIATLIGTLSLLCAGSFCAGMAVGTWRMERACVAAYRQGMNDVRGRCAPVLGAR